MNKFQSSQKVFSLNTINPQEWQLNGELEVELQAKPIDTDQNFDYLLSPVTQTNNNNFFFDHQEKKTARTSYSSVIGNNMMAYFNLRKFLQKLSRNRENFKKLTNKHLDVINDQASDNIILLNSNKNKQKLKIFDFPTLLKAVPINKNSTISNIKKNCIEQINKIPLIHPESRKKLIWDYFMTTLRIVLMIFIPIEIAFDSLIVYQQAKIYTAFTILLIIVDAFVRLNTIYYIDGKAINDRMKIFEEKIASTIYIDLLSLISLVINFGYEINGISVFYFLQYTYVYEVIGKSQEFSYFSKSFLGIIKLIWFMLTLLSILHIFSCFWFLISKNTQGENWVQQKQIQDSDWTVQYIEAFYFSIVTMITIGYGDSVPQNRTEKVVAIIFILIACLWYSYAVNIIGSIIGELTYHQEKRRTKIRVINGYMSKKKVPYSLQYKIREYLNYRWKEEQESDMIQENKLINELSNELKQELEGLDKKNFIDNCQFLQHFSSEFKQSVSQHIKRIIIQPHNTFSLKQQPSLCYLESGSLQYLTTEIKEGNFLEQFEFPLNNENEICYKAVGYASLLTISKEIFLKVIKTYQNDNEIYLDLKQKIENDQMGYLNDCQWCNTQGHSTINCPLVQYKYDKELVIKRYCFPQINERMNFIRHRTKNYFKALSDIEIIQEFQQFFSSEKQQLIVEQLKQQLSENQIDQIILRKGTQASFNDDQFSEFGIKRKSIHDIPLKSPIAVKFGINSPQQQQSKIFFLGVQKSKQTDLEKSHILKQFPTLIPNIIEENMIQNINALYQQFKEDQIINLELEMLYIKYNSISLENFDHYKSFKKYLPEFNIEEIIKNKKEIFKSYFNELIKYMEYPFLYVQKFNKKEKKRKMSINFTKINNVMKFKKALISKKSRKGQVTPQIQI